MEIIDPIQEQKESNEYWKENEKSHKRGKLFTGLIILTAGVLFLLRELGTDIPRWILSWPMLLVAIGFSVWIKNPIKHFFGGFILILIGGLFLTRSILPALALGKFVWPIVLIVIGVYVLFKPTNKYRRNRYHWEKKYAKKWSRWEQRRYQAGNGSSDYSPDNYLELNSVFGGVKKKIISKEFKGGESNAVFGGAEINLSQADFQGRVEIEINQVFGATRLIIPPHWEVHSELTAVFGSVEDKRPIVKDVLSESGKILVLEGAAVFGSIEINCF
jgi:predicted membrane protein